MYFTVHKLHRDNCNCDVMNKYERVQLGVQGKDGSALYAVEIGRERSAGEVKGSPVLLDTIRCFPCMRVPSSGAACYVPVGTCQRLDLTDLLHVDFHKGHL